MLYPLKIENEDETIRKGMQRLSTSVMTYYNSNVADSEFLESLRQEAYKAHVKSGLTTLPRLSVNVLNSNDVEYMFSGPKYVRKKEPWMEKRLGVAFRMFLPFHFHPLYQDFMIDVCLKTLFAQVAFQVHPDVRELLLHAEVEYRYPAEYKGKKYTLCGIPDYVLRYDAEKKTAAKLVVVTAKQPGFACCSHNEGYSCCGVAQIMAYMFMIHNRRMIHGEADCVVYGLITDAVGFWFYRISNYGELTRTILNAKVWPRYIDYKEVTGLLAFIFQEAYMLSPGREESPADGSQESSQSQSRGIQT